MQVWPAIDLRGGKCVRLRQGDYQQEKVFSSDPVAMAQQFEAAGAEYLHIVDLDGARSGQPAHRSVIQQIVRSVDMVCEVGGGVRDEAAIDQLLAAGVQRVVVGTRAATDPAWVAAISHRYPGRVAVGIDAKSGRVATDGWKTDCPLDALDLARQLDPLPLAAIIFTDIATDGMLSGPNLAAMEAMNQAVETPVVASGGVTTTADIAALAAIPLAGVIIGSALYEQKLTVGEALAAATSVPQRSEGTT